MLLIPTDLSRRLCLVDLLPTGFRVYIGCSFSSNQLEENRITLSPA
jgi:hypothetical protein